MEELECDGTVVPDVVGQQVRRLGHGRICAWETGLASSVSRLTSDTSPGPLAGVFFLLTILVGAAGESIYARLVVPEGATATQ